MKQDKKHITYHPGCNCPSCQFFRSFLDGRYWISGLPATISLDECAQQRMHLHAADDPPISSALALELAMQQILTGSSNVSVT